MHRLDIQPVWAVKSHVCMCECVRKKTSIDIIFVTPILFRILFFGALYPLNTILLLLHYLFALSSLTNKIDDFLFNFSSNGCDSKMCMNTQLYRRCDAAVIDDNAPSNNKRVLDTATAAAATVATNGPEKKPDRHLKKNADKCRTKTGMVLFVYVCHCIRFVNSTSFQRLQWQLMFAYNCRISTK